MRCGGSSALGTGAALKCCAVVLVSSELNCSARHAETTLTGGGIHFRPRSAFSGGRSVTTNNIIYLSGKIYTPTHSSSGSNDEQRTGQKSFLEFYCIFALVNAVNEKGGMYVSRAKATIVV